MLVVKLCLSLALSLENVFYILDEGQCVLFYALSMFMCLYEPRCPLWCLNANYFQFLFLFQTKRMATILLI